MAHEVAAQTLGTARIYWTPPPAGQIVSRTLNSPLGKLHSEGLALLRAHGWERVPAFDPRVPGFAFTTRKGADFPAAGPGLPRVRQFPQRCTAVLDDKVRLAQCLEAAGCAAIAPRTWIDLDAFLDQHSSSGCVPSSAVGGGSGSSSMTTPPAAGGGQLYFLKHRHGVKGQAVYPFTSLPSLLERLRSLGGGQQGSGQEGSVPQCNSSTHPGSSGSQEGCGGQRSSGASGERRKPQAASHGSGSRQHFVVQQGVEPPLLLADGRKFTLRAHVLLLLEHVGCGAAGAVTQQAHEPPPSQQQQEHSEPAAQELLQQQAQRELLMQQDPQLRAWVHEDVIVAPHAAPLAAASPAAAGTAGTAGTADVAVHVSSRGRGHPKPYLLSQLDLEQLPLPPQLLAAQQHEEQQRSQQLSPRHERQPEQPPQQRGQPTRPGEPPEQHPPSSIAQQLQQELWRQICNISRAAVAAGAQHGLVPSGADPQAVLYHLWAFDFAVAAGGPPADAAASTGAAQQATGEDGNVPLAVASAASTAGTAGAAAEGAAGAAGAAAEGEGQQAPPPHPLPLQPHVLLLEANSYPAIASGTMTAVPRGVYTRLIGDLLSLVVLPALGGGSEQAGAGAAGGFVRVLRRLAD